MAYPYYNNNQFYMQDLQNMREKIDRQMQQMQQLNQQQQQPTMQPQIHQNFQLAPQPNASEIQAKYVTDVEEVKNTFVISFGLFINKELNTLWLKNINGEVRTFALSEIIEQDPKDVEINNLKQEIENMKLLIKDTQDKDITSETNIKNTSKSAKK